MSGKQVRPTLVSFVAPILVIACCFYLLGRPGLRQFWKVTACIIMFLAGVELLAKLLGRFVKTEDEAAEAMHKLDWNVFDGPHEFRRAVAKEFEGMDRAFYDRATADLKKEGFTELGNVIHVTAERKFRWAHAVLRVFIDSTGTVMANVCHVRLKKFFRLAQLLGIIPGHMKSVELETELSDGRFVDTIDSAINVSTSITGLSRWMLPRGTPVSKLVSEHRRHVENEIAGDPTVRPVRHRTLKEVLEAQNRLELLKAAHVKSDAYDPGRELERIMERPLNEREQEVVEKVRELRRRERARSNREEERG